MNNLSFTSKLLQINEYIAKRHSYILPLSQTSIDSIPKPFELSLDAREQLILHQYTPPSFFFSLTSQDEVEEKEEGKYAVICQTRLPLHDNGSIFRLNGNFVFGSIADKRVRYV